MIGDPTVGAWLITLSYAAVAALCAIVARNAPADGVRDRRFWLAVSAAFAFLALNKELDLQAVGNDWIRTIAQEQGWYDRRDTIQAVFVRCLAAGCSVALFALLWLMRAAPRSVKLALLGLTVLGAFIILRATFFHQAAALLDLNIPVRLWSAILEPTAIAIVAIAAAIYRRGRGRAAHAAAAPGRDQP